MFDFFKKNAAYDGSTPQELSIDILHAKTNSQLYKP